MASRVRTAVALALLAAALAAGAAHKIQTVEEVVDVSKTPINDVTVVLSDIEQTLFDQINKPEVLEAVCTNIKPSYTKKCAPEVDKGQRRISFRLRTAKNLIEVAGGYSPTDLSPDLSFYYVPLNFLIVDEYEDVGRRSVRFNLPTFGFTLDDIKTKKDLSVSFPIQCLDGTMGCWRNAPLATDKDEYELGDIVYLREQVEYAVWTLFNVSGGPPLAAIYKCFNCTELVLPTEYKEFDCRRFIGNVCPQSRILVHAIYKKEGSDALYNASKVVTFRPARFPMVLYVGKGSGEITDTLFLGETMVVAAVANARKVTGCVVRLLRDRRAVYQTKTLPECTMVPIVTDTSWPEGEYVVQAEITSGEGGSASATQKVFLVSPGTDIPVPVSLEKASYIVGDAVSLFVNTPGERCVVELVNYTGTSVTTLYEQVFPCGAIKFELPESIVPGVYQLRVKVYRGEEYGVHVVTFRIEEWIPKGMRGSDLDRLCLGGKLTAKEVDIPCIGPTVTCQPSTTDFPVCMCFRKDGRLVDVCEFNERCSEAECAPQGSSVPFVVINEGGERFAVTGLQRLPFVTEYELCAATCICSDLSASFYHVCGPGEVCTRRECYQPLLSSRMISFSPENLRQNQIALGEGTIEAVVEVRHEGKTVTEGIDARSVSVIVNGQEVPPEQVTVRRRDFNWHISAALPKEMASFLVPGEKWVWVGIRYKGETTGVRGSFKAWYAVDRAEYNVKIHSVDPGTVAMEEAKYGAFLKLYVGVSDERGEPVSDLGRDDLSVTLDGRKVQVFSMRYVAGLRQWVLTVVVRGELTEGQRALQVEVNRLGKSGKSASFVSVAGARKVLISVTDVSPGSRYAPIFQVMERIGFDMDVMVSVKGQDVIPQATSITMDITDPETGKKLRSALAPLYVSKSQEGYRLHFGGTTAESRLQFCEGDVVGWKDISISFVIGDAATGTAGEYTATGKMLFTQNPGEWKFIGQCEGGLKEPAEGAAPEGSEAPEPGT